MPKYLSLLLLAIVMLQCQDPPAESDGRIPSTPEIEMLSNYIVANPDDENLLIQRGEQFMLEEKYSEAIADFEAALEIDSLNIEAWHLLADAYLDNLESRKALETMEGAVQVFPDSIRSFLKLSEFCLILRRYDTALQSIGAIQQMDPSNPDAYFLKGMVFKERGDTSAAIHQFQLATRENPYLIDAWINAAQLLESQDDQEAIRYYDAALSINPNHLNLLHAKAQYLAHQNEIKASISTYRDIIKVDPDYSSAYYDMGLLYLDQDSISKAYEHFDIAIKTEPMFARAYFYRGLTAEIQGNHAAALQDFEQALRLNPEDEDAAEAINRVKTVL